MRRMKKILFLLALCAVAAAVSVFAAAAGENAVSVRAVLSGGAGAEPFTVEGVYVGVSDEGAGYQKEMLLKDASFSEVIAVQGVPYGSFPDYGYDRGDLVRLRVTAETRTYAANGENKILLHFADGNPAAPEETVVSRGNPTAFSFGNIPVVDSWSDMKAFFNAETLPPYAPVRLTGSLYFNTYAANSDSIPIHRLHMNSSASALAGMKPDGKRAVGLRQNTLAANVPAAMTVYFTDVLGKATYPGASGDFDFIALVTGVNSVNFQLTVLDPSWLFGLENGIDIQTNTDILLETAWAFFRRGADVTYDQRFRCETVTPEEITGQQKAFLDCSSFVNAVYAEAFGENVLGVPLSQKAGNTANYATYAGQNAGVKPDVVGYWEPNAYTTDEERRAALDEMRSLLQPGDLLVYRHGKSSDSSGHVMLYLGDGWFIHSTGSMSEYKTSAPETSHKDKATLLELTGGTVGKLSASVLFDDPSSSRYLMRNDSSDVVRRVGIIRPLVRGLTPTAKTLARMEIAGLALKKTVFPGVSASVEPGADITYVLTVENHSSLSYTDLLFEDVLSPYLTFVSGDLPFAVNGQALSAVFSVAPFETKTIRWTARVAADAPAGARLESASTSVGAFVLPNTVLTVRSASSAQLEAVVAKARAFAEAGKAYPDPLLFVKAVYLESLGLDFCPGLSSAAELFADLLPDSSATACAFNENSSLAPLVPPRMYGGELLSRLADVVPIFYEHNFMPGDLIFCGSGGVSRIYLYAGGGTLFRVDAGAVAEVQNGKEAYVRATASSGTDYYYMNTVLSAVRAYEKCAVLRPALLDPPAPRIAGRTLVFDSSFTARYLIDKSAADRALAAGMTVTSFTVTLNGEVRDLSSAIGSDQIYTDNGAEYYWVKVSGIAPKDIDTEFTFSLVTSSGDATYTDTYTDSVLAALTQAAAENAGTAFGNAANATLAYCKAAAKAFGKALAAEFAPVRDAAGYAPIAECSSGSGALAVCGTSVLLKEELAIKFWARRGGFTGSLDSLSATVNGVAAQPEKAVNGGYYTFKFSLPVDQAKTPMTVELFANGESVSNRYTDSVVNYALSMTGDAAPLGQAIVNYVHYANEYLAFLAEQARYSSLYEDELPRIHRG